MLKVQLQTQHTWFDIADVYAVCFATGADDQNSGKVTVYLGSGSGSAQLKLDPTADVLLNFRPRLARSGITAGNWWFRSDAIRAVQIDVPSGTISNASALVTVQGSPTGPFEVFLLSGYSDAVGLAQSLPTSKTP